LTSRLDQQVEITHLLEDAVRIAHLAGAVLKNRFTTSFSIQYKNTAAQGEGDIVTEMDRAAQNLIEAEIRKKYPDHGILAEEDLDLKGSSDYLWVVDPLDGTTNYAHTFPVFSVSMAVAWQGEIVCGVVFNPISEETFKGIKGKGASLNGIPAQVSQTESLNRSLLGTGFPYNIDRAAETNLDHFKDFALQTQGIRRCGSAALDLCFVATGRLDGFWELNLKPWDIAAGLLIVREAGGVTTDFSGNPLALSGKQVLATNGSIHNQMLDVLGSRSGKGQD
jgi:myo-inositol-1(or 4)-monophosphatase